MHWLYNSMPKFSKIAQSARSTLKKKAAETAFGQANKNCFFVDQWK